MGVSGSGKSSVGNALAKSLDCGFLEADDFHSRSNRGRNYYYCLFHQPSNACSTLTTNPQEHAPEKMSNGTPLSDDDRTSWLESLRDATRAYVYSGRMVVLSCSALKRKYREILREADANYILGRPTDCQVRFVFLEAPADVIASRIERRWREGSHFMPLSLLKSQLDLVQIDEDEGIMRLDATLSLQSIVGIIQKNLDVL